ncbi:MAG TPA: alpha/beta hydrolase [Longimicrobium sp.]
METNKHAAGAGLPDRGPRSRRNLLLAATLIGTVMAVGPLAWAASPSPLNATANRIYDVSVSTLENRVVRQNVRFDNEGIEMAGHLYLPDGFDQTRKYPAIVVVHPGGGVKEQTAGLYARKLAEQGFITLAFDASHQGESGGMPRLLDDPMNRVGDIYSAVDFLTTLPYIAADRIGALGICAGSGATVKAAMTERRIVALATVSAVDVGEATRRGWDGTASEAQQIATLEAVARQRTAEASGAAPIYVPYVPEVGDTTAPRDLQEAAEYYLTPRGQHATAPNSMLLTSVSYQVSFYGFEGAETLLTQPVLIIAGSEAGSLWHSQDLHKRAAGPKELVLIDGLTHMEMYDGAGADTAMERLAPFFQRIIGGARGD